MAVVCAPQIAHTAPDRSLLSLPSVNPWDVDAKRQAQHFFCRAHRYGKCRNRAV